MTKLYAILGAMLLAFTLALASAWAGAEDVRSFDRSMLRVATGEIVVDESDGDFTAWNGALICAVTTGTNSSATDLVVTFDLAKATTGWAALATSETIQFAVDRRVDGTNWRTDAQAVTTAISGTNSAGRSVTLTVGAVTPTESVRIALKLSAETGSDLTVPFMATYRAPERLAFVPIE
jgi:hypothetical protein